MINSDGFVSPVNLLVTIDKNYMEPLATMLDSYGEYHKGIETHLYLAHSSLGEAELEYLSQKAEANAITLHNVHITEKWFKDTPVLDRLPEESFYRLMAFHYLPKEADRCLYLDPDILIRKPLLELYSTDLDGYYIAAASHVYNMLNKFNLSRLELSDRDRYLNSGIMLMNLDMIRQDFSMEKILQTLSETIQKLWFGDQDLVNILFGHKAKLLDEKIYNLDEKTFRHFRKTFPLESVAQETAIIHYNGKYKPWLKDYKGKLDRFYPEVKEKGPSPAGKQKAHIKSFFRIINLSLPQKIILTSTILLILVSIFCWFFFGKEILRFISEPELFRQWLDKFGAFDELMFILIRSAQTIIKFIPAEPLEIGSGYAWGVFGGTLYCLIGNFIGTLVILFLTKRFGKAFIEAFLPQNSFQILNVFQNSKSVYALLFFFYLIPGTPKDGFTYLVGMLQIKTVPFLIITFIARIPSVLSSTLCGSTLAEQQYLISAVVFIGTAVLAFIGGAVYKAYMNRKSKK